VTLAPQRGAPRKRLDARAILRELQALVARRNLDGAVLVREGCAGGCQGRGPNVSLTFHTRPAPGVPTTSPSAGEPTWARSPECPPCKPSSTTISADRVGALDRGPHRRHTA
jgi:hypothetical protein